MIMTIFLITTLTYKYPKLNVQFFSPFLSPTYMYEGRVADLQGLGVIPRVGG